MASLYSQLLREPSAERFFAALAAFDLPPGAAAPSLEHLDQAFLEGRFESVRSLARLHARYFALSIHFHRLASLASLELSEPESAQLEHFIADALLQSVLQSGDGSAERPYLLAHRVDAQEVLHHLKLKPTRQSRVQCRGALVDVFNVKTGNTEREIWFSLYQGQAAQGSTTKPLSKPTSKRSQKQANKVAV